MEYINVQSNVVCIYTPIASHMWSVFYNNISESHKFTNVASYLPGVDTDTCLAPLRRVLEHLPAILVATLLIR